jgi:hypothetical protein
MSAGREHRHRILDILTPEVFLSYNWGRKVVPPDGQVSDQQQQVAVQLSAC